MMAVEQLCNTESDNDVSARHIKQITATKFSRAVAGYAEHANVQKRSADDLFAKVKSHATGICLDLGAGPGVNTARLQALFGTTIAFDLSFDMLKHSQARMAICADMDALPLLDKSVDCIFSNFAVQWSQNLPHLLKELYRVLKPGGVIYLSCVVDGSLAEIKTAFNKVDSQSHVNKFHTLVQLQQYISAAKLDISSLNQTCYQDSYESPMAALRSLKAIGATNQLSQQKRKGLMTKHRLQQVCAAFPLVNERAIVSYQVAIMELKKI
ncbi:SAM-dependent methyltransferase [Pseudoalteromonas porphyrae]|uniref:methyltransferase domain-containing protein n=1 Tax=Pseudoalteromonas TaxID=53246 RepID=UPI0006CD8AB5|nr:MULTISPECIES: methyltransferase domain-containing protein [Pseudoalteromonas]KPH94960.1 SAM-dependent methyltransferase [Pseudoalteromonas porphyrae]